jgi:hypothetical protein
MTSKAKLKSKLKSNRAASESSEPTSPSTPVPVSYTYTDDDIRQQIRICLMRIKRDDAFVDGELSSEDYGPIKDGGNPDITEKFMDFVAKSMVKTSKAKKAFKKERLLIHNRKLLRMEIKKFDPDTYVMETPVATKINQKEVNAASNNKNDKDNQMQLDDDNNHDDDDDVEDDDEENNKKVAGVKKRRRPSSPNNVTTKATPKQSSSKKKNKSIAFRTAKKERLKLADELRREYLSQKADVLERLPESYKKQWGQIYFCKWKKDPHRPVLVLGPYQVHPELRETWMKMFNNVSLRRTRA